MGQGQHIEGFGNIGIQNVSGGSSVKVTQYIGKSADYWEMLERQRELKDLISQAQKRMEKFKDDPVEFAEYQQELIGHQQKYKTLTEQIEAFKADVQKLAETFNRIPLNTERLKQAKVLFEEGKFREADAILKTEDLQADQDDLKKAQQRNEEERAKIDNGLKNNSIEWLVKAQARALDYNTPNRFQETCQLFEKSLESWEDANNTFLYGYFLHEHNQYGTATVWYEKALKMYRQLALVNSEAYLPDVAATLNNLANLQLAQNELEKAGERYIEAIEVRRQLAKVDPETHYPFIAETLCNLGVLYKTKREIIDAEENFKKATQICTERIKVNPAAYWHIFITSLNHLGVLYYETMQFSDSEKLYLQALSIAEKLATTNSKLYLPKIAGILINLGNLNRDKNKAFEARQNFERALNIFIQLSIGNLEAYLPSVAMALQNLAVLHRDLNELAEAEEKLMEALHIRRQLAKSNPNVYLHDVAMTLNNLANLQKKTGALAKAELNYIESLKIKRRLANVNPQAYLPNVGMTAMNLSIFYIEDVEDKTQSLAYVKEAIIALLPFYEALPRAKEDFHTCLEILNAWGVDPKWFIQEMQREQ